MTLSFASLEFEWDIHNIEHVRRHNVEAAECEEVFFNRNLKILPDPTHTKGEERFIAQGVSNSGRLLFMAFTLRRHKIRVITARDMSKKERRQYYEKIS